MATPPAEEPFVVLTIYRSSPKYRQEFIDLLREFAGTQQVLHTGLCAFEIFTDEGVRQIVTVGRWQNRTVFEEFKRSEIGIRTAQVELVLKPKVYFLHPQALVEETAEPVRSVG